MRRPVITATVTFVVTALLFLGWFANPSPSRSAPRLAASEIVAGIDENVPPDLQGAIGGDIDTVGH